MSAYKWGSYQYGLDGNTDPLLASAIKAFKLELIYNGYAKNVDPVVPVFGDAMRNRVKEFQTARGLTADGTIGFKTAKELFRKRIDVTEAKYNLPTGTIGKMISLESGFDPSAIGYADPRDTGISQINIGIHTSVSKEQALDPAFALDWTGRYLQGLTEDIESNVNVIKAARAAYNIGTSSAVKWLLASFATSGGPAIGDQDAFERATKYIELIDKQQW